MRVTLTGHRRTSETTIWHRLDELYRSIDIIRPVHELILIQRAFLHDVAQAWAEKRRRPYRLIETGGRERTIGHEWAQRWAWHTCFAAHRPHVLLCFGELDSEIARLAIAFGTEIRHVETVLDSKGRPRTKEKCGALSPSGKNKCTRHANHPGDRHAEWTKKPDGRRHRKNEWGDEDCLRGT